MEKKVVVEIVVREVENKFDDDLLSRGHYLPPNIKSGGSIATLNLLNDDDADEVVKGNKAYVKIMLLNKVEAGDEVHLTPSLLYKADGNWSVGANYPQQTLIPGDVFFEIAVDTGAAPGSQAGVWEKLILIFDGGETHKGKGLRRTKSHAIQIVDKLTSP